MSRMRMRAALLVIFALLLFFVGTSPATSHTRDYLADGPIHSMDILPVSLTLSGWGWFVSAGCVTCMDYGNAVMQLDGSMISRDNATNVFDLYLSGTVSLNTPDETDNFTVELRGTRVRSAFFLKQVAGGSSAMLVEFEGVWFDYGGGVYIACEGRLGLPADDHVADVYLFALRSGSAETLAIPETSWLGRATVILDEVADRLVAAGSQVQATIGKGIANLSMVLLRFMW